jgi:hypothetical protein
MVDEEGSPSVPHLELRALPILATQLLRETPSGIGDMRVAVAVLRSVYGMEQVHVADY